MQQFRGLTALKELNLDSINVSDESVPTILKMQNLERLNLRGCQMTDDGFRQLSKLPKLTYLNVANTSIGYDVIDERGEARKGLLVEDF